MVHPCARHGLRWAKKIDGPGGEVLQHNGNTSATILELGVCPHDIQPIREVCFIVRIGHLHHDIQAVSNHHGTLSTAMSNDRLEAWYRTFVGKQELLVQIQGVFCSVSRKLEPFSQACSSELEALCPLKGNSC